MVASYTVGVIFLSSSLTNSLMADSLEASLLVDSLVSRLFGLGSVFVGLLVGQRICWSRTSLVSGVAVDYHIGSSS